MQFQANIQKGSIYGAFRREFLEFIFRDKNAQRISNFLLKTKGIENPDEFFWQTLAFNPELGAPGGCLTTSPASEQDIGFLARYVIWFGSPSQEKCRTKFVRGVCILGGANEEAIKQAPHLFANKFYEDFEPEAYDRLEQWYIERAHREWSVEGGASFTGGFNATATYANLQCSKRHIV